MIRRSLLLGAPSLALTACFDRPCEERNPAQLAFLDALKSLAKPALASGNPLQIEEAVYEHPSVDECIVIGIPDPYRQEAPKVFVKLKPGASLTFDELKKHLEGKIGKHEMPVALEIRAELPKTPVGKLSKAQLIEEEQRKSA